MRRIHLLLLTVLVAGALGVATLITTPLITKSYADSQGSVALTGQVTSVEEGAMEGVLVSAKKSGSTITTTVFTDDKGRYRFPAARLAPGHYSLSIRATGFDLEACAPALDAGNLLSQPRKVGRQQRRNDLQHVSGS